MQNLEEILELKFGHKSFREGQKEIVESVLGGNDTLVFMPTGGGKSLVYQFPGTILDGLVIVISPLISLMKDQVDKLNELGLKAELINSTIDNYEKQNILNQISRNDGSIKFLYIAPERLNSDDFLRIIQNVKIALIAIDEAHCISQWGHDFRPSYMKVKGFIEDLRNPPIPNPFPPREKGEYDLTSFWEKTPDYITQLSRKLRKNSTETEKIMWEILRRKQLGGIKFRRQHPFGRYIADFYSDEAKLVIELDGEIHEKTKEYDEIRDEIIEKYGVNILRIKNEEIINDLEGVIKKIINQLNFPLPWGEGLREGDLGEGQNTHFPIIALTATATKKVRADIIERLGLENPKIFTKGFERKNISIVVREISKKEEKQDKVLEILEKTPGIGIIYCSSRKMVKEVYDFLFLEGISVGMYTGEMNAEDREMEQNNFMNGKYKTIVATNAFGMGIDKKDIRFVIHYNLPGSIENYYQEVGRAGRDGKNSYGVVLASYGDTKIQQFFIENSYPSKEEILKFYDYLYKNFTIGKGKGTKIAKTYATMADESGIGNDLRVGAIIRILEKYSILKRGLGEMQTEFDFRGKGLELLENKKIYSQIGVDWEHQNLLKEESYFKLEQIKRLLFYPACRKKFILNYFGDEEDLKKLGDDCRSCDFCIEKKNLKDKETEDLVNISVFSLVLEVVKKFDERFGVQTITRFLAGSQDKKLFEWNMDKYSEFGSLSDLKTELIQAIIEALISQEFLHKTAGQYPVLGITETGRIAITKDFLLKNDNEELQQFLRMRLGSKALYKRNSRVKTSANPSRRSGAYGETSTYEETLKLFKDGKNIEEIAETRGFKAQTIEDHILKLYKIGEISLNEVLKLSDFDKLKKVKEIAEKTFDKLDFKLKPVKEELEEKGYKNISYFDIKLTVAMMEKKDL